MTESEFFENLMSKTEMLEIKPVRTVQTLPQILRLLVISLLTGENLKNLEFFSKESRIKSLLKDYDPIGIRRIGSYTDLLSEGLVVFGETKKSLVKKLCQSACQSAKYLSRFQNLADFTKKLYLSCSDADATFAFLQDFRRISSLSGMYFIKTCAFFEATGLLDVPVPESHVKDLLIAAFELENDNKVIYHKIAHIAKVNKVSCYELHQRLSAVAI